MRLAVDIAVEADAWAGVAGLAERIEAAIAASAEAAGVPLAAGAEVSVLLCDDATIRGLNRSWRRIDKPTNVLSFPAAEPGGLARAPLLGDIVVAFETAAREAEAEGKTLADHATHLIVHGFLHLLGYDHADAPQAEAMERAERRILAGLGIADPFAGLQLADETAR